MKHIGFTDTVAAPTFHDSGLFTETGGTGTFASVAVEPPVHVFGTL